MNWLQLIKLAEKELYYHGTSAVNLPTILSQGLNTEHEPVFDENFRERDRSIDTYGGIYLTKNIMTAVSAGSNANQKFVGQAYGQDHVIVMAQIERNTPSIWVDEDSMPNPGWAIGSAFPGLAPNGWWYMSWAKGGFERLDDITEKYTGNILRTYDVPDDAAPYFTKSLSPIVKDIIVAFVNREIAITMSQDDKWGRYKYDFPEFAEYSVEEMEQKYRAAMNLFAQKAHRFTGFAKGSFSRQNIRVQEPITFRGVNRIIAIFRIHDPPSAEKGQPRGYYNEIMVEYMTDNARPAIEMFIKDWIPRVGPHFIMKSRDGEVFYDKFNEEIST